MTDKNKTMILTTVSLVIVMAGFYLWINRQAVQERTIRLTLKKSGCDKAREAGLLPVSEAAESGVCRTVMFPYRGYINDEPLKIKYQESKIEIYSDEISMIEFGSD